MCGCCNIKMFEWQVFHICKWNCNVMDSDSSLALACWKQQYALNVKVTGVSPCKTIRVLTIAIALNIWVRFFNLVSDHSVAVYRRTKDQVSGLCLNLNVSVRANLAKSNWDTDTEYCFPCHFPCKRMIQLIRKFHCKSTRIVFWVVVQWPWTLLCQFWHRS